MIVENIFSATDRLHNQLRRGTNMRFKRQRCACILARYRRLKNLLVLGMYIAPGVQTNRVAPVALGMMGELLYDAQCPGRSTRRQQRAMKRGVGLLPPPYILIFQGLL